MREIMELPLLGEVCSYWRVVEFGSVLEEGTRNGIYKKKEFHGLGDKIVNMGELFANPRLFDVPMKRVKLSDSEQQRFRLKVGDLLFARRSLVAEGAGKCSIVCEINEPTAFESSIIRARPNPKIADSFYLYYLFCSSYGSYILGSILRHVAVAGITGTDLVKLLIPLPPLSEQKAIAHILSSLDDKIELNRQMNETLEAMARAIFKSWFVDFDPVSAKRSGRQPAGMDTATADLFPDEFEESSLGLIPKGWKVGTLGDICLVQGGFAYKSKDFTNQGYPVIKIKNINEDRTVNVDDVQYIPENIAYKTKDFWLKDGDLIMAMTGATIGKFGLVVNYIPTIPSLLNQRVAKLSPAKNSIIKNWFIYSTLLQTDVVEQIISMADGSAQPNISATGIMSANLVVPSDKIISSFDNLVNNYFQKILSNRSEFRILATLRDTLLPKLMSGEIRVKEAEKIMEKLT